MRDFIKELDEISTGFRGYDKEETMLYIKDLLQYCEEEKKKELDKLIEQSNSLRQELNEAKSRETTMQNQYNALLEKFEKLSDAMSENAKYTAERDAQLDEFNRKQKEIDTLLETTREKAEKEKEELLAKTQAQCNGMLADAEEKKKAIIEKGDNYLIYIQTKAQEENKRILSESAHVRQELDSLAQKLAPILWKDGEKPSAPAALGESAKVHERKGL